MLSVEKIHVLRMRLRLCAQAPTCLSGYQGSALRGVLGHALRRRFCLPAHPQPCTEVDCVYRRLFEPKLDVSERQLQSWTDAPRPFVIEAPVEPIYEMNKGEGFAFDILLMGKASDHESDVLDVLAEGLARGLGPDRVAFKLEHEGSQHEGVDLSGHKPGEDVSLRFELPLRLQQEGRLTTELRPELLVRALLERVSALLGVWQDETLTLPFRQVVSDASLLREVQSDTRLFRMSRLSGRQRKRIPLDGMVGNLVWGGGAVLDALWPLLRAGQLVHVGKGCVFGLGRMIAADRAALLQELNR